MRAPAGLSGLWEPVTTGMDRPTSAEIGLGVMACRPSQARPLLPVSQHGFKDRSTAGVA